MILSVIDLSSGVDSIQVPRDFSVPLKYIS